MGNSMNTIYVAGGLALAVSGALMILLLTL